jgi:hypothetical protein
VSTTSITCHKCARAPTTFHIATTHSHRPAHMSLSSSVSALAIATSSTCFSSSHRRRCCCRHRILFAFFSFTLLPLPFLVELDGHTDALRCTEGVGRQWLTVCRLVKRFLTRPPHRTHAHTHACLLFHLCFCRLTRPPNRTHARTLALSSPSLQRLRVEPVLPRVVSTWWWQGWIRFHASSNGRKEE